MTTGTSFEHVLLTGGAGFIGSAFARFLIEQRPRTRLTIADALTYSGNMDNLADLMGEPRVRFVRADIRDATAMRPLCAEADAIVHMAAESHVDRSIADAQPFVTTNVAGTQVLLDCWRHAHPPGGDRARFLHVSTDEVYGSLPLDRPDLRFTESTPLAPRSPYAASKAASDMLALAAQHTYGIDVVVTRCSNNFGPRQFPEKVIPLFVTNLIRGRRVPLYGDGLNVRDWLHVEDHCEALLAVLERGRSGEVYNIGGNNERANIDLTREILRIMGAGEDMIERVPDRLGHDRRYAIDASKIERELAWRPTRSAWPDALERTVRWYQEHQDWWQRVLSGAYRAES
ncbi:MAG: dTDP-glucose 4,6-dehydratase [Phycisphaerales bacterium]|nr:dTDP-glucose 4,6-dehydratase [Phycisphaerales bacterium]